jgi:hypothetical protein
MKKEYLSKWTFKKEMKDMAESCIGLKLATVRKKSNDLFEKYHDLFIYDIERKEYDGKYLEKLQNKYQALKKQSISYQRGNNKGVILLKDIEQVEITETGVLIITKTGREINLGKDFDYIKEIFE